MAFIDRSAQILYKAAYSDLRVNRYETDLIERFRIYTSYPERIKAAAIKSFKAAEASTCPHCGLPYVISWKGRYPSGNAALFWECYACGYGGDL